MQYKKYIYIYIYIYILASEKPRVKKLCYIDNIAQRITYVGKGRQYEANVVTKQQSSYFKNKLTSLNLRGRQLMSADVRHCYNLSRYRNGLRISQF